MVDQWYIISGGGQGGVYRLLVTLFFLVFLLLTDILPPVLTILHSHYDRYFDGGLLTMITTNTCFKNCLFQLKTFTLHTHPVDEKFDLSIYYLRLITIGARFSFQRQIKRRKKKVAETHIRLQVNRIGNKVGFMNWQDKFINAIMSK